MSMLLRARSCLDKPATGRMLQARCYLLLFASASLWAVEFSGQGVTSPGHDAQATRAPRLVIIHGRAETTNDTVALRREWSHALSDGLERVFGDSEFIPTADRRFVYYGDVFRSPPFIHPRCLAAELPLSLYTIDSLQRRRLRREGLSEIAPQPDASPDLETNGLRAARDHTAFL